MTRRHLVELLAAVPACASAASSTTFKFSVCNETFQVPRFEDQCSMTRAIGYEGIEIMPGTLSDDPGAIASGRRAELRRIMRDNGVAFVGLHNLLSVPKGMQATTGDAAVRRRNLGPCPSLIDLGADLGPNTNVVFGSAKQRERCPAFRLATLLRDSAMASPRSHRTPASDLSRS